MKRRIICLIFLLFVCCICCASTSKAEAYVPNNEKCAKDSSGAYKIPQGGGYIPLALGTLQNFKLVNNTGHAAYDIEISWCDENGNPYEDYEDDDNNKDFISFKSVGVINEAVIEANGTKSQIKYKSDGDKSLGNGNTMEITLGFETNPLQADWLNVTFTNKEGAVICQRAETEPNNDMACCLNLGEGDYVAAMSSDDIDYYSFEVVDDNAIVSLSVIGSKSDGLLVELLAEDGTVLASDTGKASLSILGRIRVGKYYVRVSGSIQNYLIKQSTTAVSASVNVESECPEDDSGLLDIERSYGIAGDEVTIPVRIQSAPNAIIALGFEVTYNPDVLEYLDFDKGALTKSFPFCDANPVNSGKIRVGWASTKAIPRGASGSVILLKFKVVNGVDSGCYPLALENLRDNIAQFSKSSGCFCIKDTVPPVITCPTDIIIQQIDSNGTPANDPDVFAFLSAPSGWDFQGRGGESEVEVFYTIVKQIDNTSPKLAFHIFTESPSVQTPIISFGAFLKIDGPSLYVEQPKGEPIALFSTQPIKDLKELAPGVSAAVILGGSVLTGAIAPNVSGLTGWFGKATLPPGRNNVVFAARDKAGNISSCAATITVQPMECAEDDSGELDIPGTTGKIGQEVLIPVRMQSAPNAVLTFGFEITYKPSVLEYIGFERGDLTPQSVFSSCGVYPAVSGKLIVGGISDNQGIPKGASGDIVLLKFIAIGGINDSCYPLKLENLMGDISQISKSGGCFCIHNCDGDQNSDGIITPLDALIVFQCFLELGPCGDCSDVNGDGIVTPFDALCLFQNYLGLPSCLDNIITRATEANVL